MLFDVYQLFDQSPQKVETVLGRPERVRQSPFPRMQSREYVKSGVMVTVWFTADKSGVADSYKDSYKASTFNVLLPAPTQGKAVSLEEAVATAVGVDVRGRQPSTQQITKWATKRIWRGTFKHPGIKQVSVEAISEWHSVFVLSKTASVF